jgi:pyruvate, water dikinase
VGHTDAPYVAWLDDAPAGDPELVGGKAAGLSRLGRSGLPVPPGFAVTTGAYRAFARQPQVSQRLAAIVAHANGDADGVADAILELFEAAPLPPRVERAVREAYGELASREAGTSAPVVAVRSSATAEDLAEASFAGQQRTYLGVRGTSSLLEKVTACWASLFTNATLAYRSRAGVEEAGLAMGVVIQVLVDARAAGVLFTLNPANGDRSEVVIEGAPGLGESVVGGEITPDRWFVDKVTLDVRRRAIADKPFACRANPATGEVSKVALEAGARREPSLSEREIVELARLGKRLEALAEGVPQDVEWAIRGAGDESELLLLQCRPETVWSRKAKAPRVRPAGSVLDHIAHRLGAGEQGGGS